jgi:hypothetical protein
MDREDKKLIVTMAMKSNKEIIRFLSSFFILISVSSCAERIEVQNLYGTYVAKYSFGTDKIVLKEEGLYSQEVQINGDTKKYVTTGTWKYDISDNVTKVILEKAFVVSDGLGNLKKDFSVPGNGISVFPVERYFFSRKLRLGPDEESPHIRESTKTK